MKRRRRKGKGMKRSRRRRRSRRVGSRITAPVRPVVTGAVVVSWVTV